MRNAFGFSQSRNDIGGMMFEQPIVTSSSSVERAAIASAIARA